MFKSHRSTLESNELGSVPPVDTHLSKEDVLKRLNNNGDEIVPTEEYGTNSGAHCKYALRDPH